jgi:septum formation topological specificity factor MinE
MKIIKKYIELEDKIRVQLKYEDKYWNDEHILKI